MPLRLTITANRGGDDQTRILDQGTLSIGRAPGNDWVLADPEHHLSRTHCTVAAEGGRYIITDVSTNGLLVNGAATPTERGTRLELAEGDMIQLGGYTLAVAEVDAAAAPDPGARRGPEPLGRADARSPLDADPLGPRFGAGPLTPFDRAPPPSSPAFRGIDPLDRSRDNEPAEDWLSGRGPAERWSGPAEPDATPAPFHAFPPPRPAPPLAALDIDALLGDFVLPEHAATERPNQPELRELRPDPRPDPAGAGPPIATPAIGRSADPKPANPFGTIPPSPREAAAERAAPVPEPPAGAPSPSTAAALLAEFLRGAGLPNADLSGQPPEAAMRAIGELFRELVAGTRDVLMARAEVKHELRVDRTMLRSQNNNALKFSVSAEEALLALLRPARPGYKPPLEAVQEAFADIRAHELAVMVGLQSALVSLLKRFDPAALQARLERGLLDGILPAARKARVWELFCQTYKDIAREAEDDFDTVFGREFARAYQAQIEKL